MKGDKKLKTNSIQNYQVLVEKLLRSCPGVKTIYVLLRGKRGVEPKNRLHELLNSKVRIQTFSHKTRNNKKTTFLTGIRPRS